jgi:hypothetical protein
MATTHAIEQPQCARALGETVCMSDHGAGHQTRAVLHQDLPVVAQDGWTLAALLEQTRIRIPARLMRIVAASLALQFVSELRPPPDSSSSSEPSFARKLSYDSPMPESPYRPEKCFLDSKLRLSARLMTSVKNASKTSC